MNIKWMAMTAGLCLSGSAVAAPQLAGAYASPAWIATDPAPAHVMAEKRERYERGRALHRTGNIMTAVGGASIIPLGLGLVAAANRGNGAIASLMGLGLVGGVGSYFAGGIISSSGAYIATNAVNGAFGTRISPSIALGGIVSASAGILLSPFIVGLFSPIVGVICGVVQLQRVSSALDSLGVSDVQIAPTPTGFAVSMRL